MRIRAFTLTVLLGAAFALVAASPAMAREPIDEIKLRDGQSFDKSYGPIPGMLPGVSHITFDDCRAAMGCDLIEIHLLPSREFGTVASLELSWPDPEGLNDLDFYLWDANGVEVASSPTGNNPEKMGMADFNGGRYFMGILNWAGVNTGYRLQGSLALQDLPSFDPSAYAQPDRRVGTRPEAAARPPVANPFEFGPVVSGPVGPTGPDPEVIPRHGEDGPLSELALGAVPASAQASTGDDVPWPAIIFGFASAVVVIVGTFLIWNKIRRDVTVA